MLKWNLKNMSGNNGTLISIEDLPSILCVHCGLGNPPNYKK